MGVFAAELLPSFTGVGVGVALAFLLFDTWAVFHSEEFRRDLERLRARRKGKKWWQL